MLFGMAIIKEWACLAHGPFEGPEPQCEFGCPASFVKREFRTAPAIRSAGTRLVDQQLRGLAQDYRLPDIKNDKDGRSVMESIKRGEDFSPRFIDIPHAAPGWSQRGEKPLKQAAAPYLYGRPGENAIEQYKQNVAPTVGALVPPRPAFVNAPNPAPEAFQ